MADSTEGDTEVISLGLLAPALIAVVAGLVIQSFIIVDNVSDWWKGRLVTPVDHIVTSLGISRISLPCAFVLHYFVLWLSLKYLYTRVTLIIIDVVYAFFLYTDIWLSSLLSVVFYLKIANLHSRLFLYLRGLIVQRTVYLIVASVLLSMFSCMFPLMRSITEVTKGETYNTTMNNVVMGCLDIKVIYNFSIGVFIPVLFFCISSVLLFASLYLHIRNMKMSGNLTINLETYYSVMKFVSFTFLYNTIYSIGHFVGIFYYCFYCVNLAWLYVALEYLPVLHSSYLIYRTAKLRSQMSKVLHSVTDFLFQRKYTREDIEVVAQ